MKITETLELDMSYRTEGAFNAGLLVGLYKDKIEQFEKETGKEIEVDGGGIEVKKATREQLLTFIKIFGGKWKKELEMFYPDKIKYSQHVENDLFKGYSHGFDIIASEAEPPKTCKIVEEEVIVPEHKTMKKRIVCVPDTDDIPVEAVVKEDGEEIPV